ncbi:4-hydroxybenzoate polyprenyltransferase [Catenuloplanes nepalensis]|uniref:4-hydroxybenzoate polyprenyltransferase n=1 Tax=Catenuloplanes nepalensis TaxID=587533 RepID=A0ABT9N3G9_9ACTN|nr:UbiA family prenyltransferase [Catenuloplanes nepalensis]MDP9798206.1 4-hydroxybenzoate polyprenyltransferase [Catenuloplanes nepalensis]
MALRGLFRASHPEPGLAVTAVSALLGAGAGHSLASGALVTATVLASQAAVGWSNDWLDAARDRTVGRADKPVATGTVSRTAVGVAALVSALAVPVLGLFTTLPAAACITLALVSALLYNAPLKRTPLSVLPYVVSFGALPAFVVLALPGAPTPPAWLVVAGGLLGGGAHFANVLPDLEDDLTTGVRGLPHRLGATASRLAAAVLLLAATVTLAFGPPGPPSWVGTAALVAAVVALTAGWLAGRAAAARGHRSHATFRSVLAVALIDVILLVVGGAVG